MRGHSRCSAAAARTGVGPEGDLGVGVGDSKACRRRRWRSLTRGTVGQKRDCEDDVDRGYEKDLHDDCDRGNRQVPKDCESKGNGVARLVRARHICVVPMARSIAGCESRSSCESSGGDTAHSGARLQMLVCETLALGGWKRGVCGKICGTTRMASGGSGRRAGRGSCKRMPGRTNQKIGTLLTFGPAVAVVWCTSMGALP